MMNDEVIQQIKSEFDIDIEFKTHKEIKNFEDFQEILKNENREKEKLKSEIENVASLQNELGKKYKPLKILGFSLFGYKCPVCKNKLNETIVEKVTACTYGKSILMCPKCDYKYVSKFDSFVIRLRKN